MLPQRLLTLYSEKEGRQGDRYVELEGDDRDRVSERGRKKEGKSVFLEAVSYTHLDVYKRQA